MSTASNSIISTPSSPGRSGGAGERRGAVRRRRRLRVLRAASRTAPAAAVDGVRAARGPSGCYRCSAALCCYCVCKKGGLITYHPLTILKTLACSFPASFPIFFFINLSRCFLNHFSFVDFVPNNYTHKYNIVYRLDCLERGSGKEGFPVSGVLNCN